MQDKDRERIEDRWRELEGNGYEPWAAWREIQKEFPSQAEAYLALRTEDMISKIEEFLKGT